MTGGDDRAAAEMAIPRLTQELIAARKERRTLDDQRKDAERFREARLQGARLRPLREFIVITFLWLGIWFGSLLAINLARSILEPHTPATPPWDIAAGVGPVVLATLWAGRSWLRGSSARRAVRRAVKEERDDAARRQPAEDSELRERIEELERRLAENRRRLSS